MGKWVGLWCFRRVSRCGCLLIWKCWLRVFGLRLFIVSGIRYLLFRCSSVVVL